MKPFRASGALRGLPHVLLVCLVAACGDRAAAPPAAPAGAAIHALRVQPPAPGRTAAMLARAKELARPGSVVQTEPRLGVPTFLWTREKPAAMARMASGVGRPEVAAARATLSDHAELYGLVEADVADAVVAGVHDRGTGPIVVKLRTQVGGVDVFAEELAVVLNRRLEPVALTGYLTSAATPPARPDGLEFQIPPGAAAAGALGHLANLGFDPSRLVSAGSRDGYALFTLAPGAGVALDEPIRTKPVYYHLPGGLEAAYYVEVLAQTGGAPAGVLSADGSAPAASEAYAYVVSAATGELLFRKSLTAEAARPVPREAGVLPPGGFTYRVWADPVTGIPLDTPAGNGVHPKLNPAPDGAQATFVAPSDVTLPSFPFSRNDPWLPAGATETVGNNVDAFLNLLAPDGYGNPTTTAPADPPTGDYRAQVTGPGQFLHAQVPDGNGALAEGRQGAIQQLFYDLNFLHDWYYDAGFDEAAGNAQTDNFGRGGLGNDSIKAQVQDYSGFDNANMTTGADGGRPRMRMYVFRSPANMLDLQAPATIAGKGAIGVSIAGPQTFDATGPIVRATFSNTPSSCTVTNAPALAGAIAMFDFDNTDGTGCSWTTRVSRLSAGTAASAILMVYTSAAPASVPVATGFNPAFTKPFAMTSWNTGQLVKAQLAVPEVVTARLYRAPDRDGALDAQIVFHEFFHYVSNRLVGNGAGLATNHAAGMGEGWSDFSAMMLTARPEDTATPGNASFEGAYALATFATSGVPFDGSANHGYYFGIRRYPYSTDTAKNPLTFKHIADGVALPVGPPVAFGADGSFNSEVHNTGEVWATMLWECYAALLRDTLGATPRLSFQQAQDRMKTYLIASLKAMPSFPTFTEARDALLAVALATDPADYVAFRIAFAKRGAGIHAVAPDRFSADNSGVVEDFSTGPEVAFEGATLDDSLGSCDGDGVVDHGEYGRLTIALRNTGTTVLSATTATVTTSSPDAWFPAGNTMTFPAIPVGVTASVSLRIAYLRTVSGIQQLGLQIEYGDTQIAGGPSTRTVSFRANTDELAASSATDSVEASASAWTPGFSATFGDIAPWQRVELTPISHLWHVDDADVGSDQYLVSPVLTIDAGGSLVVAFDHSWSFEFDAGGDYDGGVVEMSVGGGAFTDIGGPAYNGTIISYAGDVNPLKGRPAFVRSSGGTVHTTLTQAVAPGSAVRVRFRAGSDFTIGAAGWSIDDISVGGVVGTPFAEVVPDGHACSLVPVSADLAITVSDGATSTALGSSITYTITATNAGDDVVGATVADAFPVDLACTWTCAGSAGGGCTASGSGDILDRVDLPSGGVATYTATCAVASSTASLSLSNTATIAPPGPVTDPNPGNNASTDTDTLVRPPAHLTASKTVSGSFVPGGTVTYEIVLANDGAGRQFDNGGDELTDVLPSGLALVSASATAGTAQATSSTATWNGEIAAGSSVTITVVAAITAGPGTTISSQATFRYDADGDGVNEATGTTEAWVCAPAPGAAAPRGLAVAELSR
jgi:large repetitive protein